MFYRFLLVISYPLSGVLLIGGMLLCMAISAVMVCPLAVTAVILYILVGDVTEKIFSPFSLVWGGFRDACDEGSRILDKLSEKANP